ncbi:putative MFS family arabinose efflux permease [Nocardia tenerifensis]|uniref:Putative MFS family arabinose efflux permease n=1 Tax=Nocardia tenerifensis TaxID=228006 RepID=A0A318JWD0_9NOCA|nr:MFS transporter [Nocardia tenerifensis]PXX61763.1 putative MFS family arabinose efflux permease [Nocardia tenerifensis]
MERRNAAETRLGAQFGRLWSAATLSGFGDGVTQIGANLLAVSITREPIAVSGLMVVQIAPFIVFGLPSGVLVDRLDRRRLMIIATVVRIAVLGTVSAAVATDRASLPLLYLAFFVVGCAGLVFDNACTTALPGLVAPAQLERANGRLQATRSVTEQVLARPLGVALFGIAAWTPFLVDTVGLVAVAVLAGTLPATPARGGRQRLGAAVVDGARWLWRDTLVRTLTLTVGLSNIGLGAIFSLLVLIARERLGVGDAGYAVLLIAAAVGGVCGGLAAPRIIAALGPGTTLRIGLLIEMASYVGMASTHSAAVAVAILIPFCVHLSVFTTIGSSLRQSLVPPGLLGRVHSAYRLVGAGGLFLGALVGGLLAGRFGLAAPFWIGLACAVVFTGAAWRRLDNRTIAAARAVAEKRSADRE